MEATIFTYDGADFVRSATSLKTEEGKSATGTKLDHTTAAFKALVAKRSYAGEVLVFGHTYDAKYAPLISEDGKLTGALFIGIPK